MSAHVNHRYLRTEVTQTHVQVSVCSNCKTNVGFSPRGEVLDIVENTHLSRCRLADEIHNPEPPSGEAHQRSRGAQPRRAPASCRRHPGTGYA